MAINKKQQESIQNSILKAEISRENQIISGIMPFFDTVRTKTINIINKLYENFIDLKPEDYKVYMSVRNRQTKLDAKLNIEIRPELLKKDKYLQERTSQEYTTGYAYQDWKSTQAARSEAIPLKPKKPDKAKAKAAFESPLSKFALPDDMKKSRSETIVRIQRAIRDGIQQGQPVQQIAKEIDIVLGYRDAEGNLLKGRTNKKGEIYKSMRTARTETHRIREQANLDQWLDSQDRGIESERQILSTVDIRTRPQSAQMDGQKADEDGLFTYPNGIKGFPGNTGVAKYDINDRETVIDVIEGFEPELRRTKLDDVYKVEQFTTFKEYADKLGYKRNKYGQVWFPEK